VRQLRNRAAIRIQNEECGMFAVSVCGTHWYQQVIRFRLLAPSSQRKMRYVFARQIMRHISPTGVSHN